jgi:hypothetical protein
MVILINEVKYFINKIASIQIGYFDRKVNIIFQIIKGEIVEEDLVVGSKAVCRDEEEVEVIVSFECAKDVAAWQEAGDRDGVAEEFIFHGYGNDGKVLDLVEAIEDALKGKFAER